LNSGAEAATVLDGLLLKEICLWLPPAPSPVLPQSWPYLRGDIAAIAIVAPSVGFEPIFGFGNVNSEVPIHGILGIGAGLSRLSL
jgi:hypothetical protein